MSESKHSPFDTNSNQNTAELKADAQRTLVHPALAKPLNRFLAKNIDYIFITVLAVLPIYPVGPLLGFLYSLMMDALPLKSWGGQSVGKRLLRLRVVHIKTNEPVRDFKTSVLRNTPFAVATFFALIPLWGWIILILLGLPLMAIETYLILKAPNRQRLGDVMGETIVIQVPSKKKIASLESIPENKSS